MQLLDEIKCVECGKVEYVRSAGKSSRTFKGCCKEHEPGLFDGVPKANESAGKPSEFPKGK